VSAARRTAIRTGTGPGDGRGTVTNVARSEDGAAEAGRLLEGPSPELVRSAYRVELLAARALMPELALADLASVLTNIEGGWVPEENGRRLVAALLDLRETSREALSTPEAADPAGRRILDPSVGDLVQNREAWLRDRIGQDAGYLLVGRPRREASVVAFHLAVRRRLLALAAALERLQAELVALAAANIRTLSVDYTYFQAAQPSTIAHALLAYAYPLERDADRLQAAFGRVNRSPAGAGCTNGASIPFDRVLLGRRLGFKGLVAHTRDANWQADLAVELSALAASVGLDLDRLAEDLLVWDTREFGFVELADRASRISLAMPQKKNPYALVFVRGAAGRLLGRLAGAAAVSRTGTGQPDPRIYAQDEVPSSIELAEQGAALLAEVVAGIRFDRRRLAAGARRGYLAGNDLAETIMLQRGMPFGTAHRVVGEAVRVALERGDEVHGIDARTLDEAGVAVTGNSVGLADAEIRAALDPIAAVGRRTGIGGAAPAAVRAMISELRASLRRQRRWIEARAGGIVQAESELLAQAHAFAAGEAAARDNG
jgi:argininosuccinate lyase